MKKKLAWLLLSLLLLLAGCQKAGEEARVVLTTGLAEDEVFRIETKSCLLPEVMTVLVNTQNQYEDTFGAEIWDKDFDGITLEKNVKDNVLAQLAEINSMVLLAERHNVALDEDELTKVKAAAEAYYVSLNEAEKEYLQITPEILENLYAEFMLADKVYQYIIKDINPEISDDEARTITVLHIFFRTFDQDGTGQKIEYSEQDKQEAYEKAKEVLKLAKEEGSDFEQLVLEYSEDEKSSYSFGKGEADINFETAAFNLETNEVSDIIETPYGYHIIKCINTFNQEETDANKIKIVEKRKEEVFGEEYEAFAASLIRTMNEPLWDKVRLVEDEQVNTKDFFVIYQQYLKEES